MKTSYHTPVLLSETLNFLNPKPGQIFIDCTLGGGGHSEQIVKRISSTGKLIAIDQDPEAVEEAKKRLVKFSELITFVSDNFINIRGILDNLGNPLVDGVLMDLGVSSHQIEDPKRGFSFGKSGSEASLDMRMNPNQQLRAYDVVNFYPEDRLKKILFEYGEESFGAKISKQIIIDREKKKIATGGDLVEVIRRATPPRYRFSPEHGHWARKTFQAIRMEVNQELPVLQEALPQILRCMKSGGRLAVISFHSLEDRIVKHQFQEWENSGLVKVLTPKAIEPTPEEVIVNPKSHSAKLRVIEKTAVV